jgi:hypothetical protein
LGVCVWVRVCLRVRFQNLNQPNLEFDFPS